MPAPASDPSVMRAILAAEDAEPIVRLAAALIWLRITDARIGGLDAGRLAREARDWLLRDGPDWLEYLTGAARRAGDRERLKRIQTSLVTRIGKEAAGE